MSLFNAREWWSTQIVDDAGFSEKSLVLANVDNAPDNKQKIVVGSFSGLLRIFNVNGSDSLSGYQISDLLLELELKHPIIQLLVGLFLAASDKLHLAVLHPRKLSVYSVAGTAGFSEHGTSYNILLIYEHNLQRSAFNMIAGRFGQVKGRDFFCVQSLDGTLSFYEQESFAFSRFLPNFLLPGPIAYIADTDSFIVGTGNYAIESYRYQILAISKDSEDTEDASATSGRGRRVTSDWSIVIGEPLIDIEVVHIEKKSSAIILLGERTLIALKENGSPLFMKKLDYSPAAMCPYLNNDSIMIAVCTEHQSILVYNSDALKWAAQIPFVPITVKRATLGDIRGAIVFMSDTGYLSCNYLGSAPSVNVVTVNNSENGITNYAEAEVELQELKKIISAFNADGSGFAAPNVGTKARVTQSFELTISVSEPIIVQSEVTGRRESQTAKPRPVLRYEIQLQSSASVANVRLMVQVAKPLTVDNRICTFVSIAPESTAKVIVTISLSDAYLPPNLKMNILAAYSNNATGAPRVQAKEISLPLFLLARLAAPSKETEHTISLDVVCHASQNLNDLFSDLLETNERPLSGDMQNSLGIHFLHDAAASVTVTMTAKSPKQKFRLKSDSFTGLAFISCELIQRLQSRGVKFDAAVLDKASLPLDAYLRVIDDHLMARQLLVERQSTLARYATQYRTIEKRFLVKLKDRNPTPLNDLDILLDSVHAKITAVSEELINLVELIKVKSSALSSATDLMLKILSIGTSMKPDQVNILRASLTPHISSDADEAWEERTEVALIGLLASHLKDINDLAKFSHNALVLPKNFEALRTLIGKLVDKTYAGELLTVKSVASVSNEANASSLVKSNFVAPSNEIIPEEHEEDDEESESAFNLTQPPTGYN